MCNCTWMPRLNDTNICLGNDCLDNVTVTKHSTKCLPACDSTFYDAEMYFSQLNSYGKSHTTTVITHSFSLQSILDGGDLNHTKISIFYPDVEDFWVFLWENRFLASSK